MFFNFAQFKSKISLILKKDISLIIIPNHLILVSLDSLFHLLFVDVNLSNSKIIWPLNVTFHRALFIFNPNLNVSFRDQLLPKYKSEFHYFGSLESFVF